MGHRANYVILNETEVEIYQSGWGALSIAHDIFFGPDLTATFMRGHLTSDSLYDEVWCEGAALLDLTRKRLEFFSWYDLDNSLVAEHYTAMLQINYPGWHVSVASEGIRTICTLIGRDLEEVISEENEIDDEDLAESMDEFEPEVSTDTQAISVIEDALLSADAKSLDLQQWLQRNFSDKGLTAAASHFVRLDEEQEAKAQSIRKLIARYRASIGLEQTSL